MMKAKNPDIAFIRVSSFLICYQDAVRPDRISLESPVNTDYFLGQERSCAGNRPSQGLLRRRSHLILVTHGDDPASKPVFYYEKRLTRS